MAWFEEWFDSPYYPALYKKRGLAEAESFISHLIEELALPKGSRVLDLACGEGRHAHFLQKKGFRVRGLDLSERSIALAKQYENDGLEFSIADMRTFETGERYDLILNLFTSFGYFENLEDNKNTLKQIHKHLGQDGTFIVDFLNAKKVVENLVSQEEKRINDVHYSITREIVDGLVIKKIRITDQEKKFQFQERVQLIDLDGFESLLKGSGFHIEKCFGDYRMSEFKPDISDRLIIFAKK